MHVLPSRQKAFPLGEGVGIADRRGYCLPPFGEGVGFADGRGLYSGKCPPSAELNESKNKKVRALCRIWHKWKRLHVGEMSPANGNCYYRNKRRQRGANERLK